MNAPVNPTDASSPASSSASDPAGSSAGGELLALAERSRAQLTAPGAPFELVSLELNGQQLPAYRNAFASLPQMLDAGRVHGALEFMVYEGDRWSYDRFYQAADALAGRLQAELGVRTGDCVAIAMRNRPEWAVAFAAAALVGAVPAPLNSFGLHDELLAGLRDVQPRWLLCDAERFAHVKDDLAALHCRAAVVDGAPGQGIDGLVEALERPAVVFIDHELARRVGAASVDQRCQRGLGVAVGGHGLAVDVQFDQLKRRAGRRQLAAAAGGQRQQVLPVGKGGRGRRGSSVHVQNPWRRA